MGSDRRMTSSTNDESYLPLYDTVPEKWQESREFLVENLKKISDVVNVREIGWYLEDANLTGKQFIQGTQVPTEYRSIFRKVVVFGALPAAGSKSVPHGIKFDNNFTLIHLYASATQPATLAIPIPFAEQITPANGNIEIFMDPTYVTIAVGSNRSAFTRTFVIIEYLLEI